MYVDKWTTRLVYVAGVGVGIKSQVLAMGDSRILNEGFVTNQNLIVIL